MCDASTTIIMEDGSEETLHCHSQYPADDDRHPENHSAKVWF